MVTNPLAYIGQKVGGGTNRSIPYIDSTGAWAQDNDYLYYSEIYKKVVSGGFDTVSEALNFFVSTTGSDSNDGLTALTPFLTIQKAIESIPILAPGVITITCAAGTYAQSAVLTMPEVLAKSGNTDKAVVIKIVGATKATTIITAASNSTNIFNCFSKTVLVDFDKMTLSGGARQINSDGGFVIARDVAFLNYFTSGWTLTNGSYGFTVAGNPTTTFTCAPTSTAANGMAISSFSRFSQYTDLSFPGVRGTAATAINVSAFGAFARFAAGSITCTTDATLPPRFVLAFAAGSAVTMGGGATTTISITGPIFATSTVSRGAIRTLGGNIVVTASTNVSITNCAKGVVIDGPTSWISSGIAWTFTGCATPVEIAEGALVADTNKFSGAAITYVESIIPTAVDSILVGYDNRFARSYKQTRIADTNYTALVTDRMLVYTSLTAARTITLPTVAATTITTPAGVARLFTIKDESGNCSPTNPITIQVSGGATIDGSTTYVLRTEFAKVTVYCVQGGTNYFVVHDGDSPSVYGSLYEDNETGSAVTVTTAGTYYGWVTATADGFNMMTLDVGSATADKMTVDAGGNGVFLVQFSISFYNTNNNVLTHFAVFKNGTRTANIIAEAEPTNANAEQNISASGIISLAVGDYIDLRVTADNNGEVITIKHCSLTATRI